MMYVSFFTFKVKFYKNGVCQVSLVERSTCMLTYWFCLSFLVETVSLLVERISPAEYQKTKTKVIMTANQKKGKYHKEPIRTQC